MLSLASTDHRNAPVRLVLLRTCGVAERTVATRRAGPPARIALGPLLLPAPSVLMPPAIRAAALSFCILIALVVLFSMGPFALTLTLFSPISSALILAGISMSISLVISLKAVAGTIRDRSVRANCCPACLYDLSGVPRAADDLTECPECAAAWDTSDPAARSRIVIVRAPPAPGGGGPPHSPRAHT